MAYQIEIDVNAKVEALEQVQKALDEINGRVGVLSKSTGKMENVMTGLPRLSFHPGRRSNNFSMTYHTPSIPTKSIPFTSMSKMISISLHRDKFPSAPTFGVREEVVYQMKKEQESDNAYDVKYTAEDYLENLHKNCRFCFHFFLFTRFSPFGRTALFPVAFQGGFSAQ